MNKAEKISALAIPVILAIAAGLAALLSSHSVWLAGAPLLVWMFVLAFVLQWLVFIPSFLAQTEKFFDLTGSVTYLSVVLVPLWLNPQSSSRAILVAILVSLWALRLGSFLFSRILKDGKDRRFDAIKPSFLRFLMVWTLQGLWVSVTACCALVVLTSANAEPLGIWAVAGTLLWLLGMAIEVVADTQKSRFKANPANRGRFIDSGLWAWSRHPNYAGEILLWTGIALIAVPVLQGSQWAALISPVFVFVLLRYISGVPMLEKRADERWGDQADYQRYKARTRLLWPVPVKAH
ncbi:MULTISPECIES: DUF1295 domain-containing protein [Microbulbifer]|uniref:DUF1295 domain-containing protein n=1 Tax=Microbulbifer TaxID=48073 RepID=UPI001CD800B5|nr:DUF1295 domain-containing protein [Microbulbifer agarilyticus]MCA0900062.1 DUF1295 domain-containing protein [Microbulbifer agarilyticus]